MKKKNKLDFYFFLFSLFILFLLIFPVYNFGNKINPIIFGLPFSLFWIISCIVGQFVGIVIFLAIGNRDT